MPLTGLLFSISNPTCRGVRAARKPVPNGLVRHLAFCPRINWSARQTYAKKSALQTGISSPNCCASSRSPPISMTQTGDPKENAVAERIHRTIKEEFTNDRQINFCNIEQAKKDIKKFIEFYNQQRPHRSVQWLTPNQAHQCTGILKRVWKAYWRKEPAWGDLLEA